MKAHIFPALALALVLAGCVSTGTGTPAEPFSVTVVSGSELRSRFGASFSGNPFISAKPTIAQKAEDYIVLRLAVNSENGMDLDMVHAQAVDEKGNVCASAFTREKFTDLVKFKSSPYAENSDKLNKIGWYYLPAMKMRVPKGTRSYLLVLVGTHPIPEAVTVQVRLLIDGEDKTFEIPVSEKEAG
jgi:hypothetical protein